MRRPLIILFVLAPLLIAGAFLWWTGGQGPASDWSGSDPVPGPGPLSAADDAARNGDSGTARTEKRSSSPGTADGAGEQKPWVEDRSGGADPEVGFPAPDFALRGLGDSWVRLSDWRGEKAVIVNFWATWCPPCREEMPHFEELRAKRGHEVEIIAVNLYEAADVVEAFYEELGLTFPAALDRNGDVHQRYLVRPLPTSFIVDRDGVIRARYFGAMSYEVMERLVDMALEPVG